MLIPIYKTYCVKCGEYGHLGKNCKNIDESKMNILLSNHQVKFMKTLYGTFPSLSNDFNRDGEYQCQTCYRTFRKYKYFMYHEVYYKNTCEYSKMDKYLGPNVVILK